MPNKKGSRVAASKARAQTKAKRKARQTGPALAAAAYVPPPPETEDGAEPHEEAEVAHAASTALAAAPVAATPVRSSAPAHRERQQPLSVPGVSLRREMGFIGALTVVIGVLLAVLKVFTDLGD